MTDAPHLLTVIIPNYNYATYVAETITSVYDQTYGAMELIVVDDGSTDDSVAVIERMVATTPAKIQRVKVLRHAENRGKLAGINLALDHARGYYTIIVDADDLLAPDYAARCIDFLERSRKQDPQVGFVYTDCNLIDADGGNLDRGRSTPFDPVKLLTMSFIPEPAVTLTSILKDAAPYDETIRRGTKHHKWLRIVDNGWVGQYLAEPLFFYRMHAENLSGIGLRVSGELEKGRRGERILSGYWPVQRQAVQA
ncbi:MAG: glycosyltransferase family 2 protein [Sphingomonadales bacterium]